MHSKEASANSSLIVEFVGLPGVGKSTLSRRTAAALTNDYPRVAEPISRIDERPALFRVLSKARFCVEHAIRRPRTAIDGILSVQATEQPTTGDSVRVGFNFQYTASVVTHARSNSGMTLLDQGPYQALWSIGLRSSIHWHDLFDHFDHLLSRIAPDLVVLIEADTDTIADRLRSRTDGDTRFAPSTPEFDRGVDGYNRLKQWVQSSNRPESIVIENETLSDLDTGVHQIVDAVYALSS